MTIYDHLTLTKTLKYNEFIVFFSIQNKLSLLFSFQYKINSVNSEIP